MKKVFYGLAVAAVALSASAFTNAKLASVVYLTGRSGSNPSNYVYTYQDTPISCPNTGSDPCQLTAKPGYSFGSAGTLTQAEINDTDNISVTLLKTF